MALTALLLAGWGVPGGRQAPGAHVSVTVNRTGELDVEPFGRLLDRHDVVPGRAAEVRLVVSNLTGTAIGVRLRARTDGPDLDDQLAVRVTRRGTPLFAGMLGQLRMPTRRRLVLPVGARVPLTMRVWLPSQARAYRARSAEISLALESKAAG